MSKKSNVIPPLPLEVKAGIGRSLKSLRVFMEEKGYKTAVGIDSGLPQKTGLKVKVLNVMLIISYDLLSLPIHMISELHRLIEDVSQQSKSVSCLFEIVLFTPPANTGYVHPQKSRDFTSTLKFMPKGVHHLRIA